MVTVAEPPTAWTVADVFEEFGAIPAHRIRSDPARGRRQKGMCSTFISEKSVCAS